MRLKIAELPQDFIDEYKLQDKTRKRWVHIPVTVNPSEIDDLVPTEDKIAEAVKKLRRNQAGGASRIHAEHLKDGSRQPKEGGWRNRSDWSRLRRRRKAESCG